MITAAALIMVVSYARRLRDEDYPWGPTPAEHEAFCDVILRDWGGRELLLVLDETPNGEPLRCLRLGVAYRKRLLPVAAECYPTDRPPLPMPKLICRPRARPRHSAAYASSALIAAMP